MPTRPSLRRAETGPLNERRWRRIVEVVGLQLSLPLAILAIALATTARAKDADTAVSKQAIEAKIKYCEVCHGQSGQGFQGYYPIPRLAGQQPEYIKNLLEAFDERRRVNPIMFNVAHVLSPEMQTALATDFNKLNPKPFGGGRRTSWSRGKRSSKKELPIPMFRRAPRVMVLRLKATGSFLVWQVSSLTTSSRN